jgi:hypothetical protein
VFHKFKNSVIRSCLGSFITANVLTHFGRIVTNKINFINYIKDVFATSNIFISLTKNYSELGFVGIVFTVT